MTNVGDGYPEERLELADPHSVSAAALASVEGAPGPTLDVRIDYRRPATGDVHGDVEEVPDGGDYLFVG